MTSYTTGPGSLVFGSPGGTEFAAQVISCTVEWDVDSEDDIHVLSGGVVPGEDVFTAKLTGELLQDLSLSGINTYSWDNKGEVVDFIFIPNTAADRQVSGEVKVVPLSVGGEVKQKARSEFEWPCVGEPTLGDVP